MPSARQYKFLFRQCFVSLLCLLHAGCHSMVKRCYKCFNIQKPAISICRAVWFSKTMMIIIIMRRVLIVLFDAGACVSRNDTVMTRPQRLMICSLAAAAVQRVIHELHLLIIFSY